MNVLQARAKAILMVRDMQAAAAAEQERDRTRGWREWLAKWFPAATHFAFAPRHVGLWDWFSDMQLNTTPREPSRVEVWPRGGGKSSTAELGCVYVGAQYRRRFALYVSATQAQANKHVQAIAKKFEHMGVGRATGPYGNSLGWRIDLLRVEGGFNVLALGLDAAARGVKLDDARPDLIIFDDVDERQDSEREVQKKIISISEDLLPTGAPDAAVLAIQNLVHPNSVVSRLADHRADFLHGAVVYQEPALRNFDPKKHLESVMLSDGRRQYHVTGGEPTWVGQDHETVTRQVNSWGRAAFMREAQHDMTEVEGGLWNRVRDIDAFRIIPPAKRPPLLRITVAVDPNAEGGEGNDAAGIMVGGVYAVTVDGKDQYGRSTRRQVLHGVLLADETVPGGPTQWATAAVDAYHRWQANRLVAEKNNGGQMVGITLGTVERAPRVHLVHASRGKLTRAEPVQKLAEEGRIHHDGVFTALELELCSWQPGEPSPNRLDAYVWLFTDLFDLRVSAEQLAPWFPGMDKAKAAAEAAAAPTPANGPNGSSKRNGHRTTVLLRGGR